MVETEAGRGEVSLRWRSWWDAEGNWIARITVT